MDPLTFFMNKLLISGTRQNRPAWTHDECITPRDAGVRHAPNNLTLEKSALSRFRTELGIAAGVNVDPGAFKSD